MRHEYGISALVSQTSFGGESNGSVAKCRLFSQATHLFCCLAEYSNDTVLSLKLVGEEKIILETVRQF